MTDLIRENIALVLIAAALWTIPWKGVALWKAARKNDLTWFILLLLINSLAILEIIYIFIFSKRKSQDDFRGQMN